MCNETISHHQIAPLSEEEIKLILDHREKQTAKAGWLRQFLLRSLACVWALMGVVIWLQAHELQQSGGSLAEAPVPLSWLILLIH